jgi:hypothetical protein
MLEIKYLTAANCTETKKVRWFNFKQKRGICEKTAKSHGRRNGSAVTWKYPPVILKETPVGEFLFGCYQ